MKVIRKTLMCVVLGAVIHTQTASADTVQDAVRGALQHHPQIDVAEASIQLAKADRLRAMGQFLPSITASVEYTEDKWHSSTPVKLRAENGLTYGVSISQPLFQGGVAYNGLQASRSKTQSKQFQLESSKDLIALAASSAHASVTLARELVEHRTESHSLANQQFIAASQRQQKGAESKIGVAQARMRMMQERVELERSTGNIAVAEALYERTVGHKPLSKIIPDETNVATPFASLAEAKNAALSKNPLMFAARKSVAGAKFDKGAALGRFAPKLSIDANYFAYDRADPQPLTAGDIEDEEFQVVGRLTIPLFQQGQNYSGVSSARANLAIENANLTDVTLSLGETVTSNWQKLMSAKAAVTAATDSVTAAALVSAGLKAQYSAGQAEILDVLDSQRELVLARVSLSYTKHDYRIARYELLAATGKLSTGFMSSDITNLTQNTYTP